MFQDISAQELCGFEVQGLEGMNRPSSSKGSDHVILRYDALSAYDSHDMDIYVYIYIYVILNICICRRFKISDFWSKAQGWSYMLGSPARMAWPENWILATEFSLSYHRGDL